MKKTTLNFIFLILTGLIICWKEWTISLRHKNVENEGLNVMLPNTDGITSLNGIHFQEVGLTSEISSVFWILCLGALIIVLINWLTIAPPKLSSPNSV